jgi:hypothetical protein
MLVRISLLILLSARMLCREVLRWHNERSARQIAGRASGPGSLCPNESRRGHAHSTRCDEKE